MLNKFEQPKSNPLLKNYINTQGFVDYNLIKNNEWFWEQITCIEKINLENLTKEEQFAFWLNTYNILIIRGVLYELEKNSDWKGNISLISKLRFFILRKYAVGGKKISLNFIEHKILRKRFRDPRIHFVINCGSISCPFLPNKLIKSENLDKTLKGLTSFFINSGNIVIDSDNKLLVISKIFKWYKKNFNEFGGVRKFINNYLKIKIQNIEDYSIRYEKYDWRLNNQ
ncbi:MAG: DUF547 domain-containing protein [Asgard group archaeon]|nr:DUF547 domain-containing protein [Asgard group archaeon]